MAEHASTSLVSGSANPASSRKGVVLVIQFHIPTTRLAALNHT